MRIATALIAAVFCGSVLGFGQGLAPCGSKTPDGVPCSDPNFGVVVRFSPPVPTERLASTPQQSPSINLQQAEAPIKEQSQAFEQRLSSESQYWTYGKDGSCQFHAGNNVQSFNASTVQNYAGGSAQFEESRQMGQAAGGAIGIIINAWIAHHHRITAQRKKVRQQISAYYNATFALDNEVVRYQDTLATDFALLTNLDPKRRSIYERGAANSKAFKASLVNLQTTGKDLLPRLLAPKKVKYLKAELPMAQKTYEDSRNYAEREYLFVRFVGGLAGYFASQQMAHPASSRGATSTQ